MFFDPRPPMGFLDTAYRSLRMLIVLVGYVATLTAAILVLTLVLRACY